MPGSADEAGQAEEEYRPLLFSIAYGMTGSVGDVRATGLRGRFHLAGPLSGDARQVITSYRPGTSSRSPGRHHRAPVLLGARARLLGVQSRKKTEPAAAQPEEAAQPAE